MQKDKTTYSVFFMLQFSFVNTVSLRIRHQVKRFYIDIYNHEHGIFFSSLIRLFGYRNAFNLIRLPLHYFGIDLRCLPRGKHVKDYHLVNINSRAAMVRYLNEYYQEYGPFEKNPFLILVKDQKACDAFYLKKLSLEMYKLVEAISILNKLGHSDIGLVLNESRYPKEVLQKIIENKKVSLIHTSGILSKLGNLFIFLSLFLTDVVKFSLKLKIRKTQVQSVTLACEQISPIHNTGQVTHANFITQDAADFDYISYVYPGKKSLFKSSRNSFSKKKPIFLDTQKIYFSDYRLFLKFGLKFLWQLIVKPTSNYGILKDHEHMLCFIYFAALLKTYRPKFHCFNTFPDGSDVATRNDSGLITGICRSHDVLSLSYQNRVIYYHDLHFFFDTFDYYGIWGNAWLKEYEGQPHFIKHFIIIGNVYLQRYRNIPPRKTKTHHANSKHIVVFSSDIELENVSVHFTLDYALQFFLAVIHAISRAKKQRADIDYKLTIKLKDKSHAAIFYSNQKIINLLNEMDLIPTMITDKRDSGVGEAIASADAVISIGFTTPGLEALLLDIPSMYFTPYQYNYNRLFSPKSPIVATSVQDLVDFLVDSKKQASKSILEELDPFRDGRASERLFQYCKELQNSPIMHATKGTSMQIDQPDYVE